jgi:hypothetical protein
MSIADELSRIAEEARRVRARLGELAGACAELRETLGGEPSRTNEQSSGGRDESTTNEEAPRKLQSVS